MPPPRLIAIDLDGTLLDPAGDVSERSVAALRAAETAGARVVIATGRPPFMVDELVMRVGTAITHVVAANGAMITSTPGGEVLRLVVFDGGLARAAIEQLRAVCPGIGFAMATDTGFIHEPGFAERMPAAVPTAPSDDVLMLGGDRIGKLLAFHPDLSTDDLVVRLIGELPAELTARHMGADAVEIGPVDVDKGSGLAWLCDHLGVHADDVIAFGDEGNDIPMLRWAGRAVAMANAPDAVKAVADEIAPSNAHDGVAQVLERLHAR